jgi:hypothetical protein
MVSILRRLQCLACAMRGGHEWVGLVRTLVCIRCGTVAVRAKLGDRFHDGG